MDSVNEPATVASVSQLLETLDWASGHLGPKSEWPSCLHAAINIALPSQAQIVMFWGPDFVAFYNDAYTPTIGNKHPHAFGRPARESWSELWDDLEPLLKRVLDTGETVAWARASKSRSDTFAATTVSYGFRTRCRQSGTAMQISHRRSLYP